MKEVIYYLSDDGKRFETEEECLRYEMLVRGETFWSRIKIWNDKKEPMTFDKVKSFEDIFYFRCEDEEAANFLYNLFDEEMMTCPDEMLEKPTDLWGYLEDFGYRGEWVNIDELVENTKNLQKNFE